MVCLLRRRTFKSERRLVYNLRPSGTRSMWGLRGTRQPLTGSFRGTARTFACIVAVSIFSSAGLTQETGGSVADGQVKSAVCAACHGVDGNSVTAEWPSLAGQHAAYTANQLRAYQNGERDDILMSNFAADLSEQDILDLSAYFEAQTIIPGGADPEFVSLGESIYRSGIRDRGVVACIACHGPSGTGNPLAAYPTLQGQHATYVANTLRDYAAGTRRSDAGLNQMMRTITALLQEGELQAVSSYVQGLR